MERQPLVSIYCLVYNHGQFLRDCLEGFVKQQTNFPFEAIVHDDASTDNSIFIIQEYAEKYPNIIKPIYEKENLYSKDKNLLRATILDKAQGKYIAYCEGDDYWTDPHKLQKQADFLESHPDYAMCFHPVNKVMNGEVVGNDVHSLNETDFCADQIIAYGGCFCASPSLMVRGDVSRDVPLFRQIADVGDYPLQVWAAHKGKVHYIPQIMGCYRIQANSWTANVKPGSNIAHLKNRISWLEEYNRHINYKYDSAVYCSILDSAMVLYQTGILSKTDILEMFRHVKLLKLNVSFQRKMIVLKQLLSVKYPTIYNLIK